MLRVIGGHRILAAAFVALLALLFAAPARAAILQVSGASGSIGYTFSTPVYCVAAANDNISAVQFEIVTAPGVIVVNAVQPGAVAVAAGKQALLSQPQPGRYRVIISGINSNTMGNGVVAVLQCAVAENALPGVYPLALENIVMSDQNGDGVSSTRINGNAEAKFLWHDADYSKDYNISIQELLRVVQLFNLRGYHCVDGSEDGFGGGEGPTECVPHNSDYIDRNFVISMSELLRLIQFFNVRGYTPTIGTQDGFSAGTDA